MKKRFHPLKISKQATICIAALLFLLEIVVSADSEIPQPTEITKKQLKTAAYNSLWRLKRSMERDGFYGAKVTLNVWRSNALDAGIFKQAEYDEYKKQIYEKSIINSLQCYEAAVANENHTDAKTCLRTWKMRIEELDRFDQDRYDEMKAEVDALKK